MNSLQSQIFCEIGRLHSWRTLCYTEKSSAHHQHWAGLFCFYTEHTDQSGGDYFEIYVMRPVNSNLIIGETPLVKAHIGNYHHQANLICIFYEKNSLDEIIVTKAEAALNLLLTSYLQIEPHPKRAS